MRRTAATIPCSTSTTIPDIRQVLMQLINGMYSHGDMNLFPGSVRFPAAVQPVGKGRISTLSWLTLNPTRRPRREWRPDTETRRPGREAPC